MSTSLEASYSQCQRLARRAATSFYCSFLLLPRDKRRSMCALYAFLRHTDDLGDSDAGLPARRQALAAWRQSLVRALAGEFDGPIFPALADTIARFRIPPHCLEEVIEGVEMDLDSRQYETFADLADYCHHVASAVGLACIHIWGFSGEGAFEPVRACGLAFQLTNILRDLKEDAERGRVYLPAEDLRRFAYSADELRCGVRDSRFRDLMQFEIERAEKLFDEAAELDAWLSPDGRAACGAMRATYRGLLDEIKRRDGDVFTRRIRLSLWRKARIAGQCLLRRRAPRVEATRCADTPGSRAEGEQRMAGSRPLSLNRPP